MPGVTDARLSELERRTIDRLVGELRERLGEGLLGVWLYGSRARGENTGPDSDVDLLVLTRGGMKRDFELVNEIAYRVASEEGANPFAISTDVGDPEWLEQRREIRSFFIQEVDRDRIVLYGDTL